MKRLYLILFLVLLAFPAHAQKAYEVENVKINLKNVNPVEARDRALEAAQLKAFKALFRSLNNGEVLEFDESRVPGLIEDFELVDEQIAPNRYAATYTFRFKRLASEEFARETQYEQGMTAQARQQKMVDPNAPYSPNRAAQSGYDGPQYSQLYGQQNNNIRKTANQLKPPLLLPYWKVNGEPVLWGQANMWRGTWDRLENATDMGQGFILPIGDLSDMRITSGRLPQSSGDVEQLKARYQVDHIIVAVGERAAGSITTTLYRSDAVGMKLWKVIDSPFGPQADPYSVAAGQVMAEIRGNSNPATTTQIPQVAREDNGQVPNVERRDDTPFFQARQADTQQVIRAQSLFRTPKEWLRLKGNMSPENGIHQVKVISLTPKSATVELHLSEPLAQVQQNLGNRRVTLIESGANDQYVVQFMGS